MPVDGRSSFVDHDSPKHIGLTAALLLQLPQSVINRHDFPFGLFRLDLDGLQLLFEVGSSCGKSSFAERIIDLSNKRVPYVWLIG